MEKRWILYVFIIFSGYAYIAEGTVTCEIVDQLPSSCRYTISCEHHAGSATNIACNSEPYVTFQIMYSNVDRLSAGFFGATNFDSKVRVFNAINNTWTEIGPTALRYYSKTIQMDLSSNAIHEIQNEAFKNLIFLRYLNLSSNYIKTLHPHTFLITESRDSRVQVIDLSNNIINQISHNTFEPSASLQELYLQNNNIENLEDDVFSSLKNLTTLYLQHNKLILLNMTLINLKSLKYLDLSHNRINKLSGFEMNRLISLERVNLSFNRIEFVESNCFNQAFYLKILDLRNNNIRSIIDNIMFINNGKLESLNFYNNNITTIKENAFQHNMLLYLNLENNFISGAIKETIFAGLQRIKGLNLFKQNITSLEKNAFIEMPSLVNLNLSTNNIGAVDQSSFKNTSLLSVLDLSHNNISSLYFLKDALCNLTELYLNDNSLISIPVHTFANQSFIKKLDISMNRIVTIDQYSLPLDNLQYLNVTGNLISGVIKSNILSPARYLRFLDLSCLNISKIEDMAFADLPVLARFNLSNNAIEYIGPKNFLNMSNMFSLDLSYNQLSKLQLNGTYIHTLSALYLNNNKLTNITGTLPNSTQILYLDVSHNNITELSNPVLGTFKNLRVLYASNNKIKTFNNPQTNILSKLNTLDVSSNEISVINLSYFENLVKLDISNNSLGNINGTLFKNLDNLQALDISNNNITLLPPGVFQNVKILKLLNMSSNHLSNLHYGSLTGLNRTEVIDISRNNIAELDVHVFHECAELTSLIIDYNRIRHLDIEQLVQIAPKLVTISIGGNPLSCQLIVRTKNIITSVARSVDITSINKIYHEDNVNGIKCGDVNYTITTQTPASNSTLSKDTSSASTVLIWCSALTITLALLIVAFFLFKRNINTTDIYSQSRLQLTRSVELTGSQFQNDLRS